MQHADEGTLHSYLDGELTPAEVLELERHLSVCAPCRAKLAEARSFLGVTDELIPLLDTVPAGTKAPATAPKPRRPWPVRPAALVWAASIVLAAGIGYAWRGGPVTAPSDLADATVAEVATSAPLADAEQPRQRAARPAPPPRTAERRDAAGAGAREVPPPATLAALQEQDGRAATAGAASTMGPAAKSADAARANDEIARNEGVAIAPTPGPKRITLEQAVDILGGSIQLIDGLTPQRVEVLVGVDVAGADPGRQVVRVYYEEPDLGLVTLDQQRPGPSFESRRVESSDALPQVSAVPSAPAATSPMRRDIASLNTVSWRADGVWLSLTTRLPPERAAQLQARVK